MASRHGFGARPPAQGDPAQGGVPEEDLGNQDSLHQPADSDLLALRSGNEREEEKYEQKQGERAAHHQPTAKAFPMWITAKLQARHQEADHRYKESQQRNDVVDEA